MKYPKLGSEVKFIRQDLQTKTLVEGVGEVQGIFLDPRKMPMVRIKAGEEAYSVDLKAVDYDEEFKAKYEAMIAEVMELTKEGNEKAKVIVDEYNDKVDAKYKELLG